MSTPYEIPTHCPKCQHTPVTEFVYGLIRRPSHELERDIQAGRKALAGCVLSAESPAYGCRACRWTVTTEDACHPAIVRAKKALRDEPE